MTNTILMVPVSEKVELTKVSLGLTKAFQNQGVKVNYFQPINQKIKKRRKGRIAERKDISKPIDLRHAEHLLSLGWLNELLEEIISMHEYFSKDAEVVVVKGLNYQPNQSYVSELNLSIANALDAKVIIVAVTDREDHAVLEDQVSILAHVYNNLPSKRVLGYVVDSIDIQADFIAKIKFITIIPCKKRPAIRSNAIINFIAKQFDKDWLISVATTAYRRRLSSPLFRHRLIQMARDADKKIVLPESSDVRILKAAMICTRRKIARCILLGEPNEVYRIAEKNGIELSKKIEIIEPKKIIDRYIKPMVELRKHKGMTPEMAKDSLQDSVVLATMMLEQNEVDGVVSGAVHATANTIRPAFQLIKALPNVSLVSSIFFMCLPNQVFVYGDCAVNPNPNADQLADIAIESNDSACIFGIEPKVAMLSYSTGISGYGTDVDKIKNVVDIVKRKRPDIVIDGPLQYDSAVVEDVAKQKAPDSLVAGQATVCIFPDLNCANITYKAVQRSANIICIGPMLQGLRKPVNDLSRGCLTEDVVYTIALTAVQATHT